ncbi:hypothetical protein L7F22_048218 [Adiantum nelumboides]|nr:hypothetical protein [Adiantum nelumboides]
MDAEEFVKRCDEYQRTKTPRGRDDMPLRPMMGARAFAKWGIDFVGLCPSAYKSHAQYIIVATDYLTKWVEAKATTKNDAKTTTQFLYENIFTRYGFPIEIVSDRGIHFINEVIEQLLDEFMVIHRKSAPYHPQANGQAESTNKILVTVLTKIVSELRANWDQKLHSLLWAYRVAYKTPIGTTPFNMVYEIQAILLLEFLIPTLRVAKELEWTGHELSEQIEVLEKLDETRLRAVASIYAQKRNMKSFFDQHVINKEFATRDYVLMYTLKQHSRKLQKRGNGLYVIHDISPSGAIKLATLEGEEMHNWISGCILKKYHLPLTTEMLTKIHSAKERKNKLKDTKARAQEETKIRILKRKQKLQQQRQPPIEETTPIPLVAIQTCEQWQIGIDVRINIRLPNGKYQRALVDTGARVNVVNYTTYKKLTDQPLMHCSRNIAAPNKKIMPTMGFINSNINIDGNLCPHQFLVVADNGINESICLGVPWIRTYNAIPEWSENALLYTHNSNTYRTPFARSDQLWQLISVQEQTTVRQNPQKKAHRQVWVQKKIMEKNPKQIWIPKSKVSTTKTNQRQPEAKTEWKWQPKVKVDKSPASKYKRQPETQRKLPETMIWQWKPKKIQEQPSKTISTLKTTYK